MTYYYVLLKGFDGSPPVVVGLFLDWDEMLDEIEREPGASISSARFEFAVLDSQAVICREKAHIELCEGAGNQIEWKTSDGKRPERHRDMVRS